MLRALEVVGDVFQPVKCLSRTVAVHVCGQENAFIDTRVYAFIDKLLQTIKCFWACFSCF